MVFGSNQPTSTVEFSAQSGHWFIPKTVLPQVQAHTDAMTKHPQFRNIPFFTMSRTLTVPKTKIGQLFGKETNHSKYFSSQLLSNNVHFHMMDTFIQRFQMKNVFLEFSKRKTFLISAKRSEKACLCTVMLKQTRSKNRNLCCCRDVELNISENT